MLRLVNTYESSSGCESTPSQRFCHSRKKASPTAKPPYNFGLHSESFFLDLVFILLRLLEMSFLTFLSLKNIFHLNAVEILISLIYSW